MIFSPGSTKALWATDQEPMKGHAEKQAHSLILAMQDLASLFGFVNPHYFPKTDEKPLTAQGWQSQTERSHWFQEALLKLCNQEGYILSLIQVYCWYKWGEPLLTSEKLPWKITAVMHFMYLIKTSAIWIWVINCSQTTGELRIIHVNYSVINFD